jgi:hypothetical protein
MEKKKIDRVIETFRNYISLKEEGMPTMSTGSTVGKPGFSNAADPKGPTAGFDPLLGKKKKNGTVDFRRIPPSYRKWISNK